MQLQKIYFLAISGSNIIFFIVFWGALYFAYTYFGKGFKKVMGSKVNTMNFNKMNTLTPKQEWAITTGANLSMINLEFLNSLETGLGKEACIKLLSDWWRINTKSAFLDQADYLFNVGKRSIYTEALKAHYYDIKKKDKSYLQAFKEKYKNEDAHVIEDIKGNCIELVCLLNGLSIPYALIKKLDYENQNFIAWDLCRLVNITRYAFEANLITEADAWDIIMPSAIAIQKNYKSWEDMSVAYEAGKYVWDSGAFVRDHSNGYADNLLMHNNSPMKKLDWNLNLN